MRSSSPFSLLATGLVTLLSSWAVDAAGPTDVVVYYGQGANQERLREFCDSSSIEYISIGFVTKFRNTGKGGVLETNFGNQGFAPVYPNTNYVYNCPYLQEDIPYCQGKGKKILISIGGGAPENSYYLSTQAEATDAANDIWSAFGPLDAGWTLPRPFGNAIVDGFDLDLETGASMGGNGEIYASFAQKLRDKFTLSSGTFLLTAAPQCIYPDATLGKTLETVALDFIFVQFYNNPSCRPSNLVRGDANAQKNNFDQWNSLAATNPSGNCKWFLGLLASTSSADYTKQTDLNAVLDYVQPKGSFGGIMLWEATSASKDVNEDGIDYIDRCKSNLEGTVLPDPTSTTPPSTSTTPFAVTATAPPGETHLAIVPECNQWHYINAGDTCAVIVEESLGTVTQIQLEEWNEAARNGCNGIWANTWLCVGVSSGSGTTTTAPPSTTTAASFGTVFPQPPAETQPGVAPNCNLWHLVQSGDNCEILAAGVGNGVTYQDIVSWNPATGQSCTNLWLNYYACIGVSSTTTTTTTSSSTTTSTGLPSPTQSGFPEDCDSWDITQPGDYCSKFATDNGITLEELIELNPILAGNGCSSSFWLGFYYCVHRPSTTTTTTGTTTTTTTSSTTSSTTTTSETTTTSSATTSETTTTSSTITSETTTSGSTTSEATSTSETTSSTTSETTTTTTTTESTTTATTTSETTTATTTTESTTTESSMSSITTGETTTTATTTTTSPATTESTITTESTTKSSTVSTLKYASTTSHSIYATSTTKTGKAYGTVTSSKTISIKPTVTSSKPCTKKTSKYPVSTTKPYAQAYVKTTTTTKKIVTSTKKCTKTSSTTKAAPSTNAPAYTYRPRR